ncbi:DNA mismatch repair protein MutS [Candidatus Peregrinibacteria bacterium]|nr:DNA mismatch repair protein MutS [Candidatus Peregrinibacteria bacterium]
MTENPTPMMAQYQKMKAEYPDCILFFRLGDFYEMFGSDAVEASKILDIVLTARNKGDHRTPMCGIPYHASESYLARLTKAGKKVAICEQMSDPSLPGIVERKVIRVVTPGTTLSEDILEKKANNYIFCLYVKENYFGLSFADITTGEFQVAEISGLENLCAEFEKFSPKEVIVRPEFFDLEFMKKLKNEFPSTYFFPFEPKQESTKNLESFGVEGLPFGRSAAGTLLQYLLETQKNDLAHIQKLAAYSREDHMLLDEATVRNLELFSSLLQIIDKTETPMGGRLLRKWLASPLIQKNPIENRLEGVAELYENQKMKDDLAEFLKKMHDLERILSRLSIGTGNARDISALRNSLKLIPDMKNILETAKSPILCYLRKKLSDCRETVELLAQAISDDPPISIREGGMIRDGFHVELDSLRAVSRGVEKILKEIQQREAARTGINSLKISFNRVFGYYIEIYKTHSDKIPATYIRKQTLVNAERFITPELKELEEKILGAEEKILRLEYELFQTVRGKILENMSEIQENAQKIAALDVLQGFAQSALKGNFCRPEIHEDGKIIIKEGRHPVVEKFSRATRFVPNDTILDGNENRFMLITGPNMAGKSVYIRQVAIITLLSHIGSFVPAKEAKIGLTDRIFTRVGASDDVKRGQSTFMVEMQETANILKNATEKSLIILDEIGRGTSTYDGVSIAWAVTEHLHDRIRAKTLFATHYHELISVAEKLSGAKNYRATVKETMEGIIFLYTIEKGAIDRSYGIEVAKLAGIPRDVTMRAREILDELEEKIVEQGIREQILKGKVSEAQMDLFKNRTEAPLAIHTNLEQSYRGGLTHPALETLKQMDVNRLTPLEALQKLDELKGTLSA